MKFIRLTLTCVFVVPAAAADLEVREAPAGPLVPGAPDELTPGGVQLLKWDNGTRKYFVWWYTGAGAWVGNDFSLAPGHRPKIKSIRVHTTSVWPNDRWDGFRVALFSFAGVPGSMIWPPGATVGAFFKPSGFSGHVWAECPVGWTAPAARFVAAMDQTYSAPACDPFAVDTNPSFLHHSWRKYTTFAWEEFESPADPYRNLMLRVLVEDATPAEPSSFGRVRALYR